VKKISPSGRNDKEVMTNDSEAKMTNTKKATINCGFFDCNTMAAVVLAALVVAAANEYVCYYGDNDDSDDNGDDEAVVAALANADVAAWAAAVATVNLHLPGQTANLQ
jgi:hypothetical protein